MKYNFEVDNFKVIKENSNSQFMTVQIDVCRSGDNSHQMPISKDAIKYAAESIKGKPILAAFVGDDFGGHDESEVPVGFFQEDKPELVERDDELYLRSIGKIWKRYFENVKEIFEKKDGKTDVSMEVELLKGEEPENGKKGKIDLFSILGVTLLGVNPSIQGSQAQVLSFAELKTEYDKEQDTLSKLKNFKKDKDEFVDHPINTSKDAIYDGEWDGNQAKKDLVKEKNYKTLAPKVCLRLEDGWENREVTKLGYPVMGLHNGEWVYYRRALSSALAYAKAEKDDEIIKKVMALYEKLDLNEEDMSEMKEIEFSAVNLGDMWDSIWDVLRAKFDYRFYIFGIYEEDNKKFVIIKHENGKLYRVNFSYTEEGITLDDEATEVKIDFVPTDKTLVFEVPEQAIKYTKFEDEDEDEIEKAKKNSIPDDEKDVKDGKGDDSNAEEFGLDENAYVGAMLAMLRAETIDEIEEARKFGEDEQMNIILEEMCKMACENVTLKKYQHEKMEEEKMAEIGKALLEVKDDIKEEDYCDFVEKAKECEFSETPAFINTIKAFAYENSKGNGKKKTNKEGIIRMGINKTPVNECGSIFDRILNK